VDADELEIHEKGGEAGQRATVELSSCLVTSRGRRGGKFEPPSSGSTTNTPHSDWQCNVRSCCMMVLFEEGETQVVALIFDKNGFYVFLVSL
jgi:hypothetical protein